MTSPDVNGAVHRKLSTGNCPNQLLHGIKHCTNMILYLISGHLAYYNAINSYDKQSVCHGVMVHMEIICYIIVILIMWVV